MIQSMRPLWRKAGQWQGIRTNQAADIPVPVNKRVPQQMPRHQRDPVPTKNGNGQEPTVENRAPTGPMSSPRDPLEPQYLAIQLLLRVGRIRQRSEAALRVGRRPERGC